MDWYWSAMGVIAVAVLLLPVWLLKNRHRKATEFEGKIREKIEAIQEKVGEKIQEIGEKIDDKIEEEKKRPQVERGGARSAPREAPFSGPEPAKSPPDDDLSERDGRRYRVWFATNRQPLHKDDSRKGFSVERSAGEVYHGTCDIFVPRTHRIGSLGSPWWKRFWRGRDDPKRDDPLRLLQIDVLAEDRYWVDLARAVATVPSSDRRATVFLHGYNVSFENAALRTAQIAADLKVSGPMCFFSWPSRSEVAGYLADAAAIEASERVIFEFLVGIAERSGASRVDVIAHSMGNRALGRAVQRILASAEARSAVRFGHLILAAPDVDCDTFREVAQRYGELAQRTTLYVSQRDRTLELSGHLHKFPRAGYTPPVTVVSGIDTVDVGQVDLSTLGHGYVGSCRVVITDIYQILQRGAPPSERMGTRARRTAQGLSYWEIDP